MKQLYSFLLLYTMLFIMIALIILYTNLLRFNNLKVVQYNIAFDDLTGNMSTMLPRRNFNNMKYILQWTVSGDIPVPLVDMGIGQEGFLRRNCTYVNCYVTADRKLLGSYTRFDAIVYHGPEIYQTSFINNTYHIPEKRSSHQKYVFASIESAATYGIHYEGYDQYFNWTWTYKLDSDLRWGYIVVRDMKDNIIGPSADMNWLKLDEMDPVGEDFKLKLKSKRKAAAWFVSSCGSKSRRELFAGALRIELLKYKHVLDVYGDCGLLVCPRDNEEACDKKISDDYYFYLSFENAFSEDYVTEKLLRALRNNAIPIVYGGANYTRFMPDGIYLNALELGVKKLAAKMNKLIQNPDKYINYFKWKNHYKYHSTVAFKDTNEYCKMCAMLNDGRATEKNTVYGEFLRWWNPSDTYTELFAYKTISALDSYV